MRRGVACANELAHSDVTTGGGLSDSRPPEVPETLAETQGVPRAEQKIGSDFFASFAPPERESIAMAAIAALLVVVIGAAVYFGLLRWGYHATEFVAAIFFAVVLVRQLVGRDREEVSAEEKSNSLTGLVPALAAGALAYAITLPLYFICDDFDHLSLLRQPFMTSLWPQIIRGQFDGHVYIFYRPLGFASLFLDYRLWHDWTPGYHLTNLVFHISGRHPCSGYWSTRPRRCSLATTCCSLPKSYL
jgi:hypothetical protein